MEINETFDIHIDSVAFGGEGVGRIGGAVVFVRGGIKGEDLKIRITDKKKNFFRGEIVEILKQSPVRIDPRCPYFGSCGGCQYLHMEYSEQIRSKTGQIKEVLKKIGGVEETAVRAVPSDKQFHYRNKIKLTIARKEGGGIAAGFIGINNVDLVPVEACLLAEDAINENLPRIIENLKKIKGLLPETVSIKAAAEGVEYFFDQEDAGHNKPRTIREDICGKQFEAPVKSFFQVNTPMVQIMANEVISLLKQKRFDLVIDSYCGAGIFGVLASPFAGKVIGIDSDAASIRSAIKNAKNNNAENAVFISGKTETVLPGVFQGNKGKMTALILDPPRTGCDKKVIEAIIKYKPEKIIYISCNPPTLARDIKLLKESYKLEGVVFADMFPQTKHCEVIADLVQRK